MFMEEGEEKIGIMEAKGTTPTEVVVNLLNVIIAEKEAILKKIASTKIRIEKCPIVQIVTNLDMLRKTVGIKVKIKQIFMMNRLMRKLKKIYLLSCLSANIESVGKFWFLDSGCNNHMTGDKKILVEMDESVRSQVMMGNNSQVQVQHKGTVSIDTKSIKKLIFDVMYVPSLAQNLISLGQLMKRGYYAIFDDDKMHDIQQEEHGVDYVNENDAK